MTDKTQTNTSFTLQRRGYNLGEVDLNCVRSNTSESFSKEWDLGNPILLSGACLEVLPDYVDDIAQSAELYNAVLNDEECDVLFNEPPYEARLLESFEPLGCNVNEGDDQEIETLMFDAVQGESVLAEDLWVKVSWLSFYEEDASLRFRFSFGVDHVEDVAADKNRQHHAANLTDVIFPESKVVTNNSALESSLKTVLGCRSVNFVERIVYFNSPQGGAYLHHDQERGHAGVVYAQLSGQTFWLALPKYKLIDEVKLFIDSCVERNTWPLSLNEEKQAHLIELALDEQTLADELGSFANSTLIHLINETQEFVQRLIERGHANVVRSGDVLLLPQKDALSCCWHSVFCLGEESGQALSFAIRGNQSE